MKKLLLLALITGCTSKSAYTPLQEAVIRYAQHTIESDSARYVPLRFGRLQVFTRADSIRPSLIGCKNVIGLQKEAMYLTEKRVELALHGGQPDEIAASKDHRAVATRVWAMLTDRQARLQKLSTNQPVGQELTHSWRVGKQIDSAHFVVYNNGVVERLKQISPSLYVPNPQ